MIQLSTTVRTARAQALINAIPAGSVIRFYDGIRPLAGGETTTLLAELALSNPAGTANNGVLTFSPITNDSSADTDGEVSWGRVVDSADNFIMDFDCGTVASSAEMKFPTTNFTEGGVIRIASFVLTEGNG